MAGGGSGASGSAAREACCSVIRVRDIAMAPMRGIYRGVHWTHFEATLQLRIPLRGAEWSGVRPETFQVKASGRELIAKCTSFYVMEELHLKFRRDIDPENSWFTVERDTGDEAGRSRVLLVEVAKRTPGEAWDRKAVSGADPARSPEELRMLFEMDRKGWTALPHRQQRDQEDEHVTSREKLIRAFELGQVEECLQVRFKLHLAAWTEALERAPRHRIWGLDVSKRHLRLFLRGDASKPVLQGRLAGNCSPDRCFIQLSTLQIGVNRLDQVPVLDLTVVKADDSLFDWGADPIDCTVRPDMPDVERPVDGGDAGRLDLAGQSPAQWIGEMRERAAAAFKAGEYDDAIEYYTRCMQCTPGSETLLSNRSAAYTKAGRFQRALDDALKAQELCPSFLKIYFRKGQALQGLQRWKEAIAAFREGSAADGPNSPEWDREVLKIKHAQRGIREKRGTWI